MDDSVLQEAIRQHLELKRSHGADPAEVARLEREALGPALGPSDSSSAAPDVGEPGEPTAAAVEEPSPTVAESTPADLDPGPAQAPGTTVAFDPYDERPAASEPVPDPEAPAAPAGARETDLSPRETDLSPLPAEPPTEAPAGAEPAHGDWLAEGEEPAQPDAQADPDVLERTPEFLEETPEHDRLWFEQKPPRDFNFDG